MQFHAARRQVGARLHGRSTAAHDHRAIRAGLALAATAVLSLAAAPGAAAAPRTASGACASSDAAPGTQASRGLRTALRCLVNAERARNGLAPLRADRRLERAAGRHARDMVRRRYFAHERRGSTLAGRLRTAGWNGAGAAEAIAWGCGAGGTARGALQTWLDSPPHRAIVLGRYARAGLGFAAGVPTTVCAGAGTWVLDAGV